MPAAGNAADAALDGSAAYTPATLAFHLHIKGENFDIARIQQRLKHTVWAKGCSSWYLTADGRNTVNWPGYTFEFRLKTRVPNWQDYAVQ